MPLKDKEKYNEYMKKYMLERYYEVRKRILNLLGNKCSICGSEDNLEIDHIDCKEKKFNIAKCHSLSEEKLLEEVSKCRLLCADCHHIKSIDERGHNSRDQHGTHVCYRYGKCRCDLCRKAQNEVTKEYRRKRKLKTGKDR
jgi:hypothetical protein